MQIVNSIYDLHKTGYVIFRKEWFIFSTIVTYKGIFFAYDNQKDMYFLSPPGQKERGDTGAFAGRRYLHGIRN